MRIEIKSETMTRVKNILQKSLGPHRNQNEINPCVPIARFIFPSLLYDPDIKKAKPKIPTDLEEDDLLGPEETPDIESVTGVGEVLIAFFAFVGISDGVSRRDLMLPYAAIGGLLLRNIIYHTVREIHSQKKKN